MHELPPAFVLDQLEAVFTDIGVDAAKTGMLFSRTLIETVAGFLEDHPVPLVVDPVMVASSGAKLLLDDAVETLVERLFPLATVVTPNLPEAEALAGLPGASRRELAERLHELGAPAVVVTGGHGAEPVDHLFDGREHTSRSRCERHDVAATHGAGCTHSAALTRRCSPADCRSRRPRARRRASPPRRSSGVWPSSAPARARSTCSPSGAGGDRLARRRRSPRCASASRSSTTSPTTWS